MTSIRCLYFFGSSKETPAKRFRDFLSSHRGSAGNAAHLPLSTSNLKPGTSEVFFLQIDEEAMNQSRGFLVILKKYVHIKKGSYKHMQVEPLASVFDLYQHHTMVPFATNLSYILFDPFSGDTFSFEGASVPISTLYRSFQEFSVTAVCRLSNWHTSPSHTEPIFWYKLANFSKPYFLTNTSQKSEKPL